MAKKDPKLANVQELCIKCISVNEYRETEHAERRFRERQITSDDVFMVLRNGQREPKADKYSPIFKSWNYAFRGRIDDGRWIRVIVAFDENMMLVITVIELKNRESPLQ